MWCGKSPKQQVFLMPSNMGTDYILQNRSLVYKVGQISHSQQVKSNENE